MATLTQHAHAGQLTHDEVRRLCGDAVDWKVAAIIATGATNEDLEEAVAWLAGQGDVMGEERKALSGKVAAIYDILTADDDWGEVARRA